MAERRLSRVKSVEAALDVVQLLDEMALHRSWLVRDAADAVMQPFYAALDGDKRLCWTDDRILAEAFDTKQAAERFAVDRIAADVWVVATSRSC